MATEGKLVGCRREGRRGETTRGAVVAASWPRGGGSSTEMSGAEGGSGSAVAGWQTGVSGSKAWMAGHDVDCRGRPGGWGSDSGRGGEGRGGAGGGKSGWDRLAGGEVDPDGEVDAEGQLGGGGGGHGWDGSEGVGVTVGGWL